VSFWFPCLQEAVATLAVIQRHRSKHTHSRAPVQYLLRRLAYGVNLFRDWIGLVQQPLDPNALEPVTGASTMMGECGDLNLTISENAEEYGIWKFRKSNAPDASWMDELP